MKRKPFRSKKILESAQGEMCTIQSPFCNGDVTTTVACHSNQMDDGKGKGQKADDCFVAYACNRCHDFIDSRYPTPVSQYDQEERDWYLDRGIKRTIRRLLDKGVLVVK